MLGTIRAAFYFIFRLFSFTLTFYCVFDVGWVPKQTIRNSAVKYSVKALTAET